MTYRTGSVILAGFVGLGVSQIAFQGAYFGNTRVAFAGVSITLLAVWVRILIEPWLQREIEQTAREDVCGPSK